MIYVRDKGRLCNNILQYGHLYAWGREHGRATMSMRFAYKYRYFRISHSPHHHFLNYLWAKYAAKCGLLPVVSFNDPDADYSHEEQLLLTHRNVLAEGWYARWYELFLKYKPEIIDLFAFDEAVRSAVDVTLDSVPRADLRLGVHVRRGDYATFYDGRFFFSDEQYARLISRFAALHPDKRIQVFVCGNDPHLDETVFRQALPRQHVTFPKGNPGEDLCLLSECDYLIGPPSTFTLVAAMYRDVPLYWVEDAEAPLADDSFRHFDTLFRIIK